MPWGSVARWCGFALVAGAALGWPASRAVMAEEGAPVAGKGAVDSETRKSIETRFLSTPRQVTRGFEKAGEGYFSPDGRQIVYQAVPAGFPFYQIYTQPLDGSDASSQGVDGSFKPRRLSTGRGRTTCSYFSPDGRSVIFASSHLDPKVDETERDALEQQEADRKAGRRRRYKWDFDPYMEVFRLDLTGGPLVRLTDAPGYDAECAFSPDGKLIVFCSDRDGDADLYVMDADGGNVRQLTDAPGYDGGPFVSPDGRWVIFRSDRKKEGYLQIYAIGIDGKHEVALTDNEGVNWAPYWYGDGRQIIWAGADHSDPKARPNYDLWWMELDVGETIAPGPITRITDHSAADVLPVFSPDGKQLMWTSNRTADHSSQLWIADFKPPAPSEAKGHDKKEKR